MKKYIITEAQLDHLNHLTIEGDVKPARVLGLEEYKETKGEVGLPEFWEQLKLRDTPIRTKDNGVRNELKRIADALEAKDYDLEDRLLEVEMYIKAFRRMNSNLPKATAERLASGLKVKVSEVDEKVK